MNMSPKRVMITGASGFLGINLVRHLLENGTAVSGHDIAPFDYPEKDSTDFTQGDIRDYETVLAAAKDCDAIVHCAAALPLYSHEDIMSTDIDGTKNVLRAAYELGIERVVYISSTAVYGVPDHHPIYEHEDLAQGVGPYGEAKKQAEKECLLMRKEGMCIPILRPKSFVGPERLGVFALLYEWAMEGHGFPMLGSGDNRYQLLDVADLCEAIYLALTLDSATVNDTFNIGAKEFTTMREDFQAVLDEAGFGKKIRPLPAGPAIALLKLLEKMRLSPLYKWVYETASTDSFVSVEKAESILGFTPKYSNKDALVRNYHWFVDNYKSFRNQSGISHRVPWKQGILSIAKRLF